jgi:hypothetical protein
MIRRWFSVVAAIAGNVCCSVLVAWEHLRIEYRHETILVGAHYA